ncbi:MAG: response regulator [Deltaproteobacteria bacterium]|nr:response regulator [Deltaproteobacteria bacterium]
MDPFRVLIVDDEDDFRNTLVKRLETRQVPVLAVADGQAASNLVQEQDFDIVILDVKMPGKDGIQTLQEIKKLKPGIEVILLTGHASVESGIQGMRLGAFDYLIKPTPLDDLLDKMQQALAKTRKR